MSKKTIIGVIAVVVIIGFSDRAYSSHQLNFIQNRTTAVSSDTIGTQTTGTQSTDQNSHATTSGNSNTNNSDTALY